MGRPVAYIANCLLEQIRHDSEGAFLDEYWEQIDSGRIHGHGLSLQRIPKEVRHAALGHCYHYDFKAASYALMTSMAMHLAPTLQTAALQDYVRYRSAMRARIAADVGISEDWMKSIFTSLGFGAELKDNPFSSIRKKLGQEKYHKLIANSEFTHIATQLKAVSETIVKFVGKGDFEWLGKAYSEVNAKDGKKRSSKQLLAWLYQCMESDAMGMMLGMIPDGYKVLLTVHDGIYLDKPLPAKYIADIKWKLRQRYALLDFAGQKITPIHAEGFVDKVIQAQAQWEQEHSARMAVEHALAEDWHLLKLDVLAKIAEAEN